MYPSLKNPYYGCFIKEQKELIEKKGADILIAATDDTRRGSFNALRKYSRLAFKALRLAATNQFDIIHAHTTFFGGFIGLLIAWLWRKPLIVTIHGTGDVGLFTRKNFLHGHRNLATKLAKFCLARVDGIIAVSDYLKTCMVNDLGISPEKIRVIDMGVNTDLFSPTEQKLARAQLNLPEPDTKILLYVGSLHKTKGVDYLLKAILQMSLSNYLLVVIGDGLERSALEAFAHEQGLHTLFTGILPKENIPLWMSAADLLVHPSLSEGFGLVALEALSCRTPVVVSKVGGLPEIVDDDIDGYLIDPANPPALAAGIAQGLQNATRLRKQGREKALRHDSAAQVAKVLEFYQHFTQNKMH